MQSWHECHAKSYDDNRWAGAETEGKEEKAQDFGNLRPQPHRRLSCSEEVDEPFRPSFGSQMLPTFTA
jgi:hypothetical protein